jgi:hypothetical protein
MDKDISTTQHRLDESESTLIVPRFEIAIESHWGFWRGSNAGHHGLEGGS